MFVPELGKIVIAGNGGLSGGFNDLDPADAAWRSTSRRPPTSACRRASSRPTTRTSLRASALPGVPFGNTRTVIRGGYGIFYGTDSLYRYDGFSDTYPFLITQTFSAITSNPLLLTVSNPFPAAKAKTSGVTSPSGEPVDNPTQYLQPGT